MGSSDTEVKALAVMPCTSFSESSVITVMPVAKQASALRNSAWLTLILQNPRATGAEVATGYVITALVRAFWDRLLTPMLVVRNAASNLLCPRAGQRARIPRYARNDKSSGRAGVFPHLSSRPGLLLLSRCWTGPACFHVSS